MFDIGWTEMALIAVVAVIVIGPKELPRVMREMGYWVSRARNLSLTFMDQLEEISRQSGIDEVRKEVEAARHFNPAREIERVIDPDGTIERETSDLARVGAAGEPGSPEPATPTVEPRTDPKTPPEPVSAPEPSRGQRS